MATSYLSIGTNLGNRYKNLQKALYFLEQNDITIEKVSQIYETEPCDFQSKNMFYNICISIKTMLNCFELLNYTSNIETKMGRIKHPTYQDRIIDIDILFYDKLCIFTDHLIIPHKKLHLRKFVLEPLNEIAPDLIHPIFNETVKELLKKCPDTSMVYKTNINLLKKNETIN
ncbi:MAG: 2-amino-4-hydroxy-6-hydroxymethyldihydropteridine diphosphokinase [Bacteroidales bacterium]|nr:2-amino-4-hydroxy-6-hydroxymethyldihydropteridine diphosphokinase [Bacteroidales bacterium]